MSQIEPPRRRYRISFRVSAFERQALNAAAERCRLKLSDHARAVLLGAKPPRRARRPAVEAVLIARVLAKLGVVATALGDIAAKSRHAGSQLAFSPGIERELLQSLSALRTCRDRLLEVLGRRRPR